MGYVAAEDAGQHLADAVVEVSQGRFTASPAISDVVMRLTSNYLAARPSAISQPGALPSDAPYSVSPSDYDAAATSSGSGSGFTHSSHLHSVPPSGFEASNFSGFSASSYALSQIGGSSNFAGLSPSHGLAYGPTQGRSLRSGRQLLSERESEILQLIAGGLSSAEMAQELSISVPTVNTHIRNIFTKLGVRTRAQAIHTGVSQGLILVQ
jgi:DNA-binding CsgD family transcriptional regulator